MADVESKSIPHELPSSHWSKATGQCVLERYLSATMLWMEMPSDITRNVSEFAFFCRSKQGSRDRKYCNIFIVEMNDNEHT